MATPDKPLRHRKVGPYRVLGELGRGGMAQVYRGVHETLQREVALKELLPHAAGDKESVSRFRREAFALGGFRHQNIVTLYDLVEKNETLFMVMEYVDGPTLSELIKDGGALPPDVAAVIGVHIARALEHAHYRHIIHRDLKPSNVMITKAGEVKLMDFGIAKDEGLETLTRDGIAVGTPAYMSPEQVTGAPLDGRTDLFSLGVVLYEALAGERPFQGRTAGEVFARIRDGKCVPLARRAPQVPRALQRVVTRAMQVRPRDRYPDATALRRELELFLARAVRVSHEGLLVSYLRYRERVTETEARAHLTEAELGVVNRFQKRGLRARLRRWGLTAAGTGAALGAAGGAAWLTHAQWAPVLRRLLPLP